MTVSEWADKYRKLSAEASSESGQWRTDRFPLQREIMDACIKNQQVVVMSSAQVGKSEVLLNIIGYLISFDPCPMLILQPTLEMAEDFSKTRIAPMIRDSSILTNLFNVKSKESNNTILHKQFHGGRMSIAGANSPSSLASRPIRAVLCDECDRYPISAGTEGDPIMLAYKRTTTFWNKFLYLCSTPTIKDVSRIEKAYSESDQRKYYIPCPHCNHMQTLSFDNLTWQDNKPETTMYACIHCSALFSNADKLKQLKKGEWRKHNDSHIAGFHLSELYSVWRSFEEIVQDYLFVKDDPARLKTFTNTVLGEVYDEFDGDSISADLLKSRAEIYPLDVCPANACILTAGVDVQDNRLVILIEAWGRDMESWIIHYEEILGSPSKDKVWQQLDYLLEKSYYHENGHQIKIEACAIDSGGHYTHQVYQFVRKNRFKYHVFAVKGLSTYNKPILNRPSKVDVNYQGQILKNSVELYGVGTDSAKNFIYNSLKVAEFGKYYTHFSVDLPDDFFKQLVSEKREIKFVDGYPISLLVKDRTVRNEALDCKVYSLASAHFAGVPRINFDKRLEKFKPIKKDDQEIINSNDDDMINHNIDTSKPYEDKKNNALPSRKRKKTSFVFNF